MSVWFSYKFDEHPIKDSKVSGNLKSIVTVLLRLNYSVLGISYFFILISDLEKIFFCLKGEIRVDFFKYSADVISIQLPPLRQYKNENTHFTHILHRNQSITSINKHFTQYELKQ